MRNTLLRGVGCSPLLLRYRVCTTTGLIPIMTLLQFAGLNIDRQVDVIKQEGAFLSVRNETGIDVILYQIGGFYAEVFFEAANGDKLHIKSFDDTEALDAYLDEINLSDLNGLL